MADTPGMSDPMVRVSDNAVATTFDKGKPTIPADQEDTFPNNGETAGTQITGGGGVGVLVVVVVVAVVAVVVVVSSPDPREVAVVVVEVVVVVVVAVVAVVDVVVVVVVAVAVAVVAAFVVVVVSSPDPREDLVVSPLPSNRLDRSCPSSSSPLIRSFMRSEILNATSCDGMLIICCKKLISPSVSHAPGFKFSSDISPPHNAMHCEGKVTSPKAHTGL